MTDFKNCKSSAQKDGKSRLRRRRPSRRRTPISLSTNQSSQRRRVRQQRPGTRPGKRCWRRERKP